MANALGSSYAAASNSFSPLTTGGTDLARLIRDQLAEQAKKRQKREPSSDALGARVVSPAAFDLLGQQPLG